MSKDRLFILAAALFFLFAACGKKEEPAPSAKAPAPPQITPPPAPPPAGVTVGDIVVGKTVSADKKVTAPTTTFAKGDTIYVSVDTAGTGTATLKARWTYEKGGQTTPVNEESRTISPTGPATTEFHVVKPGGWPAGEYQVELFLDGKSIGVKRVTVA